MLSYLTERLLDIYLNKYYLLLPISTRLKKSITSALLFGLKLLVYLKRGVTILLRWFVINPLKWIGYGTVRPAAVFLYKKYLPVRQKTHSYFASTKKSILYPLTTKYIVHVVIIIATILVTTNSLSAREVRTEDFGQDSILASLVGRDSDEIVETAESLNTKTTYADTRGVLKPNNTPPYYEEDEDTLLATSGGGTTLIKTSAPTTSIDREGVEEYIVQGGDTVSSIAASFGISSSTILWANNLNETDYIKPGQKLKVPPTSGVVHEIKSGDTISSLAKKYEADENEILEFNKLADATAIDIGQQLIIPGGRIAPPPPAPTRTVGYTGSVYSSVAPPGVSSSGGGMQWPVPSRRIYQYFTWRHTGIDIDGNTGQPIYASSSGRVSKAQGGWNGGYGIMVVVDHGNGMQTLYAHTSRIYVNVGDYVEKGQTIAAIGSTGRSSGSHLHFEVRIGGRRVNPLSYL